MRVLVVRLGAFGDIIHSLPLAADLAAAGHRVEWLCDERWACLLDGSPAIARVHCFPHRRWRQAGTPWRQRLHELRRLRRRVLADGRPAVIDAQGLAKSALLSHWLVGRPIAHRLPRAREGSRLLPATRVPADALHVIDQQRCLALPITGHSPVDPAWRFPLPLWSAATAWAADWLASRDLQRPWLLNVGAGWPTKVWPAAQQAAFARRCRGAGRPLVACWGSPAEQAVARRLCAEQPGTILAPATDLPRLAGLLRLAGGLVSGDTGPLYLGMAVGCPCVGLFGPVPASRNGPRGRYGRALQAPGAPWERHDVTRVDMAAISPAMVFDSLTHLDGRQR